MVEMNLAHSFDEILDAIHEDLLIADGKGNVLKVSPTFEDAYGIQREYAMGKTVYELEEEGYFKPSIVAKVIQRKTPITMRQKTNKDRDIIVSATPVFDKEGKIKYVVTFSRDITEILQLQKEYSNLENQIEKYAEELNQLRRNAVVIEGVIGNSPEIHKILQTIKRVADFNASVLFLGPSGVGKTMFAKIVHQNSSRKDGPFIDINCAAIPENLLESELFGYEKGAFTGANANGKVGLIELANGGTLLLDEISEMPLSLQAKLLKVIQDKVITRIGGTREIKVDFRLITATNKQLDKVVEEGAFRKDLYYRLNVIDLEIPALHERKEDIIPLLEHFLKRTNDQYQLNKSFHPQATEMLVEYQWPGNVRELINIVERVCMTAAGKVIMKEDLPEEVLHPDQPESLNNLNVQDLEKALEAFEGKIIRDAYDKYKTTTGVGKALNISQPTAHRKIAKYVK